MILSKEEKRQSFEALRASIISLNLSKDWRIQYYEISIAIKNSVKKRELKIDIYHKVYIDRFLKSGVKSSVYNCENQIEAMKIISDKLSILD